MLLDPLVSPEALVLRERSDLQEPTAPQELRDQEESLVPMALLAPWAPLETPEPMV